MRVLQLLLRPATGGAARGAGAWVETADADEAQRRAAAALAAAGWVVEKVLSNEVTTADDYFRACPSQQAFVRAQADGFAWRFDDE